MKSFQSTISSPFSLVPSIYEIQASFDLDSLSLKLDGVLQVLLPPLLFLFIVLLLGDIVFRIMTRRRAGRVNALTADRESSGSSQVPPLQTEKQYLLHQHPSFSFPPTSLHRPPHTTSRSLPILKLDTSPQALKLSTSHLALTAKIKSHEKLIEELRAELAYTQKKMRVNAFKAFCDRLVLENVVKKLEKSGSRDVIE